MNSQQVTVVLGVDFDNTIVCYDALFHDVARDMGLVTDAIPRSKNAIREHVQSAFSNTEWTLLQAQVYGARLDEAPCYPGVMDFFARCAERQIPLFIVSHKTQFAAMGVPYDLRQAALDWLDAQGFFASGAAGLDGARIVFAETRSRKLAEIERLGCTTFIDDLPEVFDELAFPAGVTKILFDPADAHAAWSGGTRVRTWADIASLI